MIYFTSDLHLNHKSCISMCERPFESIEEMNRVLIDNINARVKMHDTLYILGDLSFKGKREEVERMISQIKCKHKILIKGNHDRNYTPELFEAIYDYREIHVSYEDKGFPVVLMHYPLFSWKNSRNGALMLHGHIHSRGNEYNLQMKEEGIRRYDVGVDANNYKPVSLEEILSFMEVLDEG